MNKVMNLGAVELVLVAETVEVKAKCWWRPANGVSLQSCLRCTLTARRFYLFLRNECSQTVLQSDTAATWATRGWNCERNIQELLELQFLQARSAGCGAGGSSTADVLLLCSSCSSTYSQVSHRKDSSRWSVKLVARDMGLAFDCTSR